MRKQLFSYYCRLIWRYYLLAVPPIFFATIAWWLCPGKIIKGIRVANPMPETWGNFTDTVESALSLIAKSDTIRVNRVKKEIRTILHAPAPLGSTYERALRLCSIDMRYTDDSADPEFVVKMVASLLIHEATYGHLFSRGILPTKRNRWRFDQLCCKEPRRFLNKIGMTSTPWDPDRLDTLAGVSFWRLGIKQIRDVLENDTRKNG